MIKDVCIKLNIDRLGRIFDLKKNNYPHDDINYENAVAEPEVVYQKIPFRIFNSFEEANDADAKAKANTSPEQHLINVTQRIKRTYADELKTPMNKTLKFRNND